MDLDGEFNDSEEVDEDDDDPQEMMKAAKQEGNEMRSGPPPKEVKGEKLENQPYDLAVDVNDSEEIESDEDDDEVRALEDNNQAAAA